MGHGHSRWAGATKEGREAAWVGGGENSSHIRQLCPEVPLCNKQNQDIVYGGWGIESLGKFVLKVRNCRRGSVTSIDSGVTVSEFDFELFAVTLSR